MLNAGKLRHRIVIQRPVYTQDGDTGDMVASWVEVATVWAAIEPASAREFVAAQAEQSKIMARITIRYRDDIDATMRLLHTAKFQFYNIEGILSDKESGLEYLTIPVSEGIRYEEEVEPLYVVNNGIQVTVNGVPVIYTP